MRQAKKTRDTYETQITVQVTLEGTGKAQVTTGIGFFDHMLTHLAKHSLIDIELVAKGDLEVDGHHTVEDVGIVLGQALKEALGTRDGIARYGDCVIPMDEALVLCAIDLSGRPYLVMDTPFTSPMVGQFDTQLVEVFFSALAVHLGMNLHLQVLRGHNDHHIIEGMCKAVARALRQAVASDAKVQGVASTKGCLEV